MLEQHVGAAITRRRLYSGPAVNHVDDFSDWLHRRGYKKTVAVPNASIFRCLDRLANRNPDWSLLCPLTLRGSLHRCPSFSRQKL